MIYIHDMLCITTTLMSILWYEIVQQMGIISIDVLKWLEFYIISLWQDNYIPCHSVYNLFKDYIYKCI